MPDKCHCHLQISLTTHVHLLRRLRGKQPNPFPIVSDYTKGVKTSWTYSTRMYSMENIGMTRVGW